MRGVGRKALSARGQVRTARRSERREAGAGSLLSGPIVGTSLAVVFLLRNASDNSGPPGLKREGEFRRRTGTAGERENSSLPLSAHLGWGGGTRGACTPQLYQSRVYFCAVREKHSHKCSKQMSRLELGCLKGTTSPLPAGPFLLVPRSD